MALYHLGQLLVWAYSVNVFFGLAVTGILLGFVVWMFTLSARK